MFRTANPAFNKDEFKPAQTWDDVAAQHPGAAMPSAPSESGVPKLAKAAHMTVGGTVNKTFLLLAMCMSTAILSWNMSLDGAEPTSLMMPFLLGGVLGGLVLGLVCSFAPKTAPVTAPLYALAEGCFVGGISALYAVRFSGESGMLNSGLIFNAGLLTFGIFGGLLTGYATGMIRPGPVFKKMVVTATLGVFLYALIAMGASLFGSYSLASVYNPSNGGLVSIGFSLLLVGIASANLVLDFDFIEHGAKNQAPRYMEWYGGFGLLVTLVWLYVEVLRLLAKLQSRE